MVRFAPTEPPARRGRPADNPETYAMPPTGKSPPPQNPNTPPPPRASMLLVLVLILSAVGLIGVTVINQFKPASKSVTYDKLLRLIDAGALKIAEPRRPRKGVRRGPRPRIGTGEVAGDTQRQILGPDDAVP